MRHNQKFKQKIRWLRTENLRTSAKRRRRSLKRWVLFTNENQWLRVHYFRPQKLALGSYQ